MSNEYRSSENNIEWITGDGRAGMTLSQTKWINRLRKLHDSDPEAVGFVENSDGSVFASVPLSWVKVTPPRKMSPERKEELASRMRGMRAAKDSKSQ